MTVEVWRPYITPKHSFILWLGAKSKLLVMDLLTHLNIDGTCVLSGSQAEIAKTGQHLLFNYSFTSCIWAEIQACLGIKRSATMLLSTLKGIKNEAWETCWQRKVKRIALASTINHIWTAWNRRIF